MRIKSAKIVAGRQAQYYILSAVILCVAVFGLLMLAENRGLVKKQDSFQNLAGNCYNEAVLVANQAARSSNSQMFQKMTQFAEDFKKYSGTIDRNFGFMLLATNTTGGTKIMNFIEPDTIVEVETNSSTKNINKSGFIVSDTDYVKVRLGGYTYAFKTEKQPNVQFLFWSNSTFEIRVLQK